MIRFACPSCENIYSTGDQYAGRVTKCKKCNTRFMIPVPEGMEPPPPAQTPPSAPKKNPPRPDSTPSVPALDFPIERPTPDLALDSVHVSPQVEKLLDEQPIEAPTPLVEAVEPVTPADAPPPPTSPDPRTEDEPQETGFSTEPPAPEPAAAEPEPAESPARTEAPTEPTSEPTPSDAVVELAPCPKCAARLTVNAEDVGKDVQCPLCETIFPGQRAEQSPPPEPTSLAPAPVPVPPPSPPPSVAIEEPIAGEVIDEVDINPCPKCQASLTVETSALGAEVECPHCGMVYIAQKVDTQADHRAAPVAVVSAPAPPPPRETNRFKMKSFLDEEDEDDRRSRRRRREADDDDDDDRPRRKKKRRSSGGGRRRNYEESNATMCLVLTLIGWFVCGLVLFIARTRCEEEMDRIDRGRVDPSTRGMVQTSLILAKIGIILFYVGIALTLLWVVAIVGLGCLGAAASS